jgi:hypothetical protein
VACSAGHLICTLERLTTMTMYHHHHEQDIRLVSPRTTAARRHLLGLAKRHGSISDFQHAGVYLRDRKWCNLSSSNCNIRIVS